MLAVMLPCTEADKARIEARRTFMMASDEDKVKQGRLELLLRLGPLLLSAE